jgi:hypothetical protein
MKRLLSVLFYRPRQSGLIMSQGVQAPRVGWNGKPVAQVLHQDASDPYFESLPVIQIGSAGHDPEGAGLARSL